MIIKIQDSIGKVVEIIEIVESNKELIEKANNILTKQIPSLLSDKNNLLNEIENCINEILEYKNKNRIEKRFNEKENEFNVVVYKIEGKPDIPIFNGIRYIPINIPITTILNKEFESLIENLFKLEIEILKSNNF